MSNLMTQPCKGETLQRGQVGLSGGPMYSYMDNNIKWAIFEWVESWVFFRCRNALDFLIHWACKRRDATILTGRHKADRMEVVSSHSTIHWRGLADSCKRMKKGLIGFIPLQFSRFEVILLLFIILQIYHYNFTFLEDMPLLTPSRCL